MLDDRVREAAAGRSIAPHAGYGFSAVPGVLARRFVIAATWTHGACCLLPGSVSAWVFRRLDGA